MPKKAIDYSKTHFYKIVCKDTNISDCYVGHTTDFTKRKNQHKTRCCNPENPKHHLNVYKCIRENGGWNNWEMVLIDTIKFENNLEARAKEREFTEQIKPSLNIFKPMRTEAEENNYYKEYYYKNIDRIKPIRKKYRDEHAEEYRQDRKNNPEKYRALDRQNYLKRPPKYFEEQKRKVECFCGGAYTKSNKAVHFKTKTHQAFEQEMNN